MNAVDFLQGKYKERAKRALSFLRKNPHIDVLLKKETGKDICSDIAVLVLENKDLRDIANEIKKKYLDRLYMNTIIVRGEKEEITETHVVLYKQYKRREHRRDTKILKPFSFYIPTSLAKLIKGYGLQNFVEEILKEAELNAPVFSIKDKMVTFSIKLPLPIAFKVLAYSKNKNCSLSASFISLSADGIKRILKLDRLDKIK